MSSNLLYRNHWTNRAGFGMEASFRLSHTVLYGNSGISKTSVVPSGFCSVL